MNRSILLSLLMTTFCLTAQAQTSQRNPRAEVRVTVGFYGHDEDLHRALGGAFTYYPAPRVSAETEFLYLLKEKSEPIDRFRGMVVTPSVGADFRRPGALVQPMGKIAASFEHVSYVLRTSPLADARPARAESRTAAFGNFRIGFKFYIGDRFFVYPEIGMGAGVLYRASMSAGYVTSKRGS